MIRLLGSIALAVGCAGVQALHALPPSGLTQIAEESDGDAKLAIVGDVAYISGRRDVWVLDENGSIGAFRLTHSDLGMHSNPSRVVRGPDEELFVGATFFRSETSSFSDGAGLYALNNLDEPVATWEARLDLVGIGSDLRGVANHQTGQAVRLLIDGTFEELQFPQGTLNAEAGFVYSTSESGYAVGLAFVPGTIGDAASLWTPSGDHFFLDNGGVARSVRDRNDGSGINIGWSGSDGSSKIQFGDSAPIQPRKPNGDLIFFRDPLVSDGDFAVLGLHGFQPGLVPGQPDVALPIEQIFPELASVDFALITDVTAVDGHIFMTLSGDDGLFLFGARAPVSIPEPTTWTLLFISLLAAFVMARRRRAP